VVALAALDGLTMNQAILAARLISVVIGAITDRADALADRDRAPAGRGRAAGGAGQDGGGAVNECDDYVRPPSPWRMYVAVVTALLLGAMVFRIVL
jgi:hypothetical protein